MKSFVTSAISMAVLSMLLGVVVHGLILHREYGQLPSLFRPEADAKNYFPFMLFAHLLMGTGITWIYP